MSKEARLLCCCENCVHHIQSKCSFSNRNFYKMCSIVKMDNEGIADKLARECNFTAPFDNLRNLLFRALEIKDEQEKKPVFDKLAEGGVCYAVIKHIAKLKLNRLGAISTNYSATDWFIVASKQDKEKIKQLGLYFAKGEKEDAYADTLQYTLDGAEVDLFNEIKDEFVLVHKSEDGIVFEQKNSSFKEYHNEWRKKQLEEAKEEKKTDKKAKEDTVKKSKKDKQEKSRKSKNEKMAENLAMSCGFTAPFDNLKDLLMQAIEIKEKQFIVKQKEDIQ